MATQVRKYKATATIVRHSGIPGCGPTWHDMELFAENDEDAIRSAREELKKDWRFLTKGYAPPGGMKDVLVEIRVREERVININEEISQKTP